MLAHQAVTVESHAAPRYGEPSAGARDVPFFTEFPDRKPFTNFNWKKYYPLFERNGTGHLFNIAVYLHKQQGIMAHTAPRMRRRKKKP
ncbi:MAG: hypothetical protein ACYTGH_14535 [Planctomycetota bacterium]